MSVEYLRFATCGSVDDGKSTLIGRLLFDVDAIPDDQIAAAESASAGRPVGPERIDFSLLLDGLSAEREQGITIDVAYRYFETPRRIFRIADSPGHEQFTRNMATAASDADAAIVIVDVRKGVLLQTRRHLAILALLRVPNVLIAVNKMDLLGFDRERFGSVASACRAAAASNDINHVEITPVSATLGENVARRGKQMQWHEGPTVLEWLEVVGGERASVDRAFRMPVQLVNRSKEGDRSYCGRIASGQIKVGDVVRINPSTRTTTIKEVRSPEGTGTIGVAGQSVSLRFAEEVEAGRGALLSHVASPPLIADQFRVKLAWFSDAPLFAGRSYLMRTGTASVPATITDIKFKLDLEHQNHLAANSLTTNEIGICNIATDRLIACDSFLDERSTGGFILIDRISAETVAAGTIDFALRRASNIAWQAFKVDRAARAQLKGHSPAIIWLTGLSGAGKSTIADLLERRLTAERRHTFVVDGDNIRHGLNRDLGFTEADRVENVRRMAEVAKLMAEAGLVVIVAAISPFRRDRELARNLADGIDFLEVFIDTPLEVCEARDVKGLYAKARAGTLRNFTGLDSPYEAPTQPELHLPTSNSGAEALAEEVFSELRRRRLV